MENRGRALITGGSSGIGKEYARQLASKGYNIILTARNESKLEKVKNDLENDFGVEVETISVDLSAQEGIDKLSVKVKSVSDLVYLVNNAGFAILGRFEENDVEKHRSMLMVHINASVELTHAALPIMREKGNGNIVFVSSVAAFNRASIYGGSKQFLVNFAKYIRKQTRGTEIRVQALCPGYTQTNFHQTEEYKSRGLDPYNSYSRMKWYPVEKVVSDSLRGLDRGKLIVVPGLFYKLAVFLSRIGVIRR